MTACGAHGDRGVTLVQSNVPILDSDAWSLDYLQQTLSELRALSVRPAQGNAGSPGSDHLAGIASAVLRDRSARARHAGEVARATDSFIIAGSMGIEHAGDPRRPPDIYNSAALVAPNGAWMARYDKIHLVPFGEFVPFENLISFAKALTREIGTFARGTQRMPLDEGDMRVGTFICYESVFPNEVRQFALQWGRVVRQHLERRMVRRDRRAACST